ncbi:macrophage immunometabolism regulator-like isoform X10 [Phycodurus eques]|nr:macrophage immunometabolism regulator-like isoform X10 [Phycodurus eques]
MASFYKHLGIEFMEAEELYQKRILTITGICIALLVVGIMCVVAYCKTKKQRKKLHDRLRQNLRAKRTKLAKSASRRQVSNLPLRDLQQTDQCNGTAIQQAAEKETETTFSASQYVLSTQQPTTLTNISSQSTSLKMEVDLSGVSRAHVSILPAAEMKATLKAEPERPRCASTPCSPIRGTVAGYQILHMDSNYLVGFTTGEELLKLAHKWSENSPEKSLLSEVVPSPIQTGVSKSLDVAIHRSSRIYKTKNRYYQPYDIPAANGRRRRRMPSSSDTFLRSVITGEHGRGVHAPLLPLCRLKGKRTQSKSLDYLNLDKITIKESPDTEVLQYQLQHLTLRGERMFTRNKT